MSLAAWLFLVFATSPAFALSTACSTLEPAVHLVQSVPDQTDLAVPGIPFAQEEWVRLIDASRTSIDIEQMYLDGAPGHSMDPVIDALARASERGVQIRLIISKQMFKTSEPTLEILKKRIRGLEHRVLHLGAITGGIQHAKFFIFDRKTLFVGSQNFDWKALSEILETGVVIQDTALTAQLQSIFDLDWQMAETGSKPENLGVAVARDREHPVQLVAAPPSLNPKNIESMYDELVRLLRGSKKRVRITLLDISTFLFNKPGQWLELDDLLRATAARGVKIELLVSHWNTEKPEVQTIQSLSQVPNIEVRIATVPENTSGSIPYARVNHSKMMIVDDEVLWVGTSNWTRGYFFDTRGIEIVIKRIDLAAQGNLIFDRLWNAPYTEPVDPARDYPKPRK